MKSTFTKSEIFYLEKCTHGIWRASNYILPILKSESSIFLMSAIYKVVYFKLWACKIVLNVPWKYGTFWATSAIYLGRKEMPFGGVNTKKKLLELTDYFMFIFLSSDGEEDPPNEVKCFGFNVQYLAKSSWSWYLKTSVLNKAS